jgi:LysM repeat protein
MRTRTALPLAAAAALVFPAAALADVQHVVARGESLSSIAATDGLSVAALAAANGLSSQSRLVAGRLISIPARFGGAVAAAPAARSRETAPTASATVGSYVVRRGDTLSGLAARAGVSVRHLAALNGLRVNGILFAGATLKLPGSGTTPTEPAASSPAASVHNYVVRRGDTLSEIAARAGVSVRYLAALNGLRVNGILFAGATLRLSGSGAARAETVASPAPSVRSYVVRRGDTLSALAARAGVSVGYLAALNHIRRARLIFAGSVLRLPGGGAAFESTPAAPSSGRTVLTSQQSYVVQPGDTLSGIAARAGVSVRALAAVNRIRAARLIYAGATLMLPAGSQPVGAPAAGGAGEAPYPTPERVTATQVEQIAAENGVPGSLAAAIGWQESGFNNDFVSSANARGVMQILPKTWRWIGRTLTPGQPLAPASALDNVRAGVLFLHSLLDATGGNAALAVAGYFQGLRSVRRQGMYADTRQYVKDILSLQRSFGGP